MWIEALDHWLDWSGAVIGRAEAKLLWARFHRYADDTDEARQSRQAALASRHRSAPAAGTDRRPPRPRVNSTPKPVDTTRQPSISRHHSNSPNAVKRPTNRRSPCLPSPNSPQPGTIPRKRAGCSARRARSAKQLGAKRSLKRADQIEARLRRTRPTTPPASRTARSRCWSRPQRA